MTSTVTAQVRYDLQCSQPSFAESVSERTLTPAAALIIKVLTEALLNGLIAGDKPQVNWSGMGQLN